MRWSPTASRLLATYILGIATAVWFLPVMAGPAVQRLRLERDEAQQKQEALQREVLKLKETLQKQQGRPLVKRARVELESPREGDKRVLIEVERRVQKHLDETYVGRAIDDISPLILYQDLDRHVARLLVIDGVEYTLDIRFLSVAAEMTLYGVLAPHAPER